MSNIIYLNKINNYENVLKKEHRNIPLFFKKIIYVYKNIFNIITKKNINGLNIYFLPIKEKYNIIKISNILKKVPNNKENIYVIPKELENNEFYKKMNLYGIKCVSEERIKKILLNKVIEYVMNLQKNNINNLELTILVNQASNINLEVIEYLAKKVKNLKIVSCNIYKFKKIEERLYKEYGIALQFSNSHKKSLSNSKLIVNFDFNPIDINEYEIFDKSIIINCTKDNIKVKSKLFNGIIINSYNIKFKDEIEEKFRKAELYNNYNNLILYESYIYNEIKFDSILKHIEEDNVKIINVKGNNGVINKNEFKNINKKLDK